MYEPCAHATDRTPQPSTVDAGLDKKALHRISNDPLVRRYLWDDEPVSVEAIRDLVHRSTRTFSDECVGLFGIRLRGREDLVGFCGFVRLEGMDELEARIRAIPDALGRGPATEAARVARRATAFEEAGLRRVIAGADPPNVASLRVLEKLGMEQIGNINPLAPEEPYYRCTRKEGKDMARQSKILAGPDEGARLPVLDISHKVTAGSTGGSLMIEEWEPPTGLDDPAPHPLPRRRVLVRLWREILRATSAAR